MSFYAEGRAGIAYRSTLDGEPCVAVVEGRAAVAPYGAARTLRASDEDLMAVCATWGIIIEPEPS